MKHLKELLRNKGVIKPKTTETPVQQRSFDDMFENSQLAQTTNGRPGTTVNRLGGEKFARISQEVDDLCASATTLDQLQMLENRVKMFRSDPQRNVLLNKIEAQKIVLVENALKTNPLGI